MAAVSSLHRVHTQRADGVDSQLLWRRCGNTHVDWNSPVWIADCKKGLPSSVPEFLVGAD